MDISETAKLVLNNQGRYLPRKYERDVAGILSFFLAFHIKDEGFFFYEWLKNPDYDLEINGNFGWIERWSKKIIILRICFDKNYQEAEKLEGTVEEFKKIVKSWMKIYKKKPQEIIIQRDDDKLTINELTILSFK